MPYIVPSRERGESLDQLNDLFAAWAEQIANRRVHAETGQRPIDRFEALLGAPGPHPSPAAPPHVATGTCQNMNTECCRLTCKHRGR